MKVTLMMVLDQSKLQLYQTYKNLQEKVQADSAINHTISISKYNPLAGSSYVKLLKELDHSRKVLINIQNIDDNECFKWCLVRYLNPADHHPAIITKVDKAFSKILDFKQIIFLFNVGDIRVFSFENKEFIVQFMYQKIYCEEKHIDLLLIKEKVRALCFYQRFQYNHTLHR